MARGGSESRQIWWEGHCRNRHWHILTTSGPSTAGPMPAIIILPAFSNPSLRVTASPSQLINTAVHFPRGPPLSTITPTRPRAPSSKSRPCLRIRPRLIIGRCDTVSPAVREEPNPPRTTEFAASPAAVPFDLAAPPIRVLYACLPCPRPEERQVVPAILDRV